MPPLPSPLLPSPPSPCLPLPSPSLPCPPSLPETDLDRGGHLLLTDAFVLLLLGACLQTLPREAARGGTPEEHHMQNTTRRPSHHTKSITGSTPREEHPRKTTTTRTSQQAHQRYQLLALALHAKRPSLVQAEARHKPEAHGKWGMCQVPTASPPS